METKTRQLLFFVTLPLLVIAAMLNYQNWLTSKHIDHLTVDFFNVGQGDSFLITTMHGHQILVDAGPGSSVIGELSKAMPIFDKTIDMIVVTHPHTDHIEGFIQVLQRYDVKKVLLPNVDFDSPQNEEFTKLVKEEGAEVVYAQEGQRWTLDEATVLGVMYPTSTEEAHPKESADVNNSSVVAMLIFGRTKFLLTGDSGTEIEDQLIKRFSLDADVLKVGHHGSEYSSSQEFLDKVTPEFAVIQVGKNNYGHPAPETLERLKNEGAKVLRNDQDGTIEFQSDGSSLVLKN